MLDYSIKYICCFFVFWVVQGVIRNSLPEDHDFINEKYNIQIGSVTYTDGTSLSDGITPNGNYSIKSSNISGSEGFNIPTLEFSPRSINFSQLEFGVPAFTVVTITNTSPSRSVDLISIHTSSYTLLFKQMSPVVLEPLEAKLINLLFIPNKIGHIEAELYVISNSGSINLRVCGFSTPSKYGLRAIKAKRLSTSTKRDLVFTFSNPNPFPIRISHVNSHGSNFIQPDKRPTLYFSAGPSFQEKRIPRVQDSVTIDGQIFGAVYTLQFSNIASRSFKGHISGTISLSHPSTTNPLVPTNSSGNFLLGRFLFEPFNFMVPIELHFLREKRFIIKEEFLDFGILQNSESPKHLRLTAYNGLTLPSYLLVKSCYQNNFIRISYEPVDFPDNDHLEKKIASIAFNPAAVDRFGDFLGCISVEVDEQPRIVIPYKAVVLQGSLHLSYQQLSFYCGGFTHLPQNNTNVLQSKLTSITNTFDFPLEILGYRMPEAFAELFDIYGLIEAKDLRPLTSANITIVFKGSKQNGYVCQDTSFNLVFYTNISSFSVSLNLYSAKLKITSPKAEESDGILNFGVFEINNEYILDFYISNPNPIQATIQHLKMKLSRGSPCVNLAQLKAFSTSLCHQSAEAVISDLSEEHCTSSPLILQPLEWTHFSIMFRHSRVESSITWTLIADSDFLSTSKLLKFRISTGSLTIRPVVLNLGTIFPGKSVSRNVLLHNSYEEAIDIHTLFLHSNNEVPGFQVDLPNQARPVVCNTSDGQRVLSILQPHQTTLIGSVSFNATLGCKSVFADVSTLEHVRVCYAGFGLESPQGGYWFATIFFPFSRESGLLKEGITSVANFGPPFIPGLRYSVRIFNRLRKAWLSINRRLHKSAVGTLPATSPPAGRCPLTGKLAFYTSKGQTPFVSHLAAQLSWPRVLVNSPAPSLPSVSQRQANENSKPSSACHLTLDFENTKGFTELRMQNLISERVTCLLTFINPTEKPLFIQVLLLDDLLPASMNFSELLRQMPILSEEFSQAAQLPDWKVSFPHHPSQRSGRFLSRLDVTSFEDESFTSLRSVLYKHNLQQVILPTCCSVYVLPPNGGYAVYSVTFQPGAFHKDCADPVDEALPQFDNSVLLLRNNLTSLEAVFLRTITETAIIGLRAALVPTHFIMSERTLTSFPTANGSPYDVTASFNPSLTNPVCIDVDKADTLDIFRYHLRSFNGEILCPDAVSADADLSLCRVAKTLQNNSTAEEAFFTFNFHEGHLKSLCADGAVNSRPSVTKFLNSLKTNFLFNWFYAKTDSLASSGASHFDSPSQLAWAVDDDGSPIFSSEFISSLTLSRHVALYNPGTLPVWVMRVGFKRHAAVSPLPSSSPSIMGHCEPHLLGFSLAACVDRSTPASAQSRLTTADGALREFELKPGEQRWFEVSYAPDFLHTDISVDLCLFASLRAPTTNRPVWLSKRMTKLEPVGGNSSAVGCNVNQTECSVFQLSSVTLRAKISSSVAKLCHSALLRPPIEENVWSILLLVFASNLAGIFIAASFDALRLLSFHESFRPPTLPKTCPDTDQHISSHLFNLNFNLPWFAQDQPHQQSPYFRVICNSPKRILESDDTPYRRRVRRTSAIVVPDPQHSPSPSKGGTLSLICSVLSPMCYWSRIVCQSVTQSLAELIKPCKNAYLLIRGNLLCAEKTNKTLTRKSVKLNSDVLLSPRNQLSRRGVVDATDSANGTIASRKGGSECVCPVKQSSSKASDDFNVNSTSSNAKAGSDANSPVGWFARPLGAGLSKPRGGGAKHPSSATNLSELEVSPKGGAMMVKKSSITSMPTPASPKTRFSKSCSATPTIPPTNQPQAPVLIMESIKAESASRGFRKPKQVSQNAPVGLNSKSPAIKPSPPQTSTKPTNLRYSGLVDLSVSKQKSPESTTTSISIDNAVPTKKPLKGVIASKPLASSATPRAAQKASFVSSGSLRRPVVRCCDGDTDCCGDSGYPPASKPSPPWTIPKGDTLFSMSDADCSDMEFPPLSSSVMGGVRGYGTTLDTNIDLTESGAESSSCDLHSFHPSPTVSSVHDACGESSANCWETTQGHTTSDYRGPESVYRPRDPFLFIPSHQTPKFAPHPQPGLYNFLVPVTLFCPFIYHHPYIPNAMCSTASVGRNFSHAYEPIGLSGYNTENYNTDGCGHRRRRSSTGQICTSEKKLVSTIDSSDVTDEHDTGALFYRSYHKSTLDFTSRVSDRETEPINKTEFDSLVWLNSFNAPMSDLTAARGPVITDNKLPTGELEQFTTTRRQWMLMHEQRRRSISDIPMDESICECERIETSPPEGQYDEPAPRTKAIFDKTVGGQLTEGRMAIGTANNSTMSGDTNSAQQLPDVFGALSQKTWLPAYLPWHNKCPHTDPAYKSDYDSEELFYLPSFSSEAEPSDSTSRLFHIFQTSNITPPTTGLSNANEIVNGEGRSQSSTNQYGIEGETNIINHHQE